MASSDVSSLEQEMKVVQLSSHLSELVDTLELSREIGFCGVHLVLPAGGILCTLLLELELQKLVIAWVH